MTTVITATPPTPNGDLHLGHLSGPYLNADACARYLRSRGEDVVFTTGSDANQAYVLSSAEKEGRSPEALVEDYSARIQKSLHAADIAIDAFVVPDARHASVVQEFYRHLYDNEFFTQKTMPALWNEAEGRFADYAFVAGYCAHCFAPTAESVCEACGHPIAPSEVLAPHSASKPAEALVLRDRSALVLELERHRGVIESLLQGPAQHWRPHVRELIERMLREGLPDFAITNQSTWGIPAPFSGFEGQVLTGWAELLPGFVRAAESAPGLAGIEGRQVWDRGGDSRIIQFLGYDNSYFFAVPHVILASLGDRPLKEPEFVITNEFYDLGGSKFSTSQGNVIWVTDFLREHAVDDARLFLALTNPETQRVDFTLASYAKVTAEVFIDRWHRIDAALATVQSALARRQDASLDALVPSHRERVAHLMLQMERAYAAQTFSLRRAAELLVNFWEWFEFEVGAARNSGETDRMISLWGVLEAHSAAVAPIAPRFADTLRPPRLRGKAHAWGALSGPIQPFPFTFRDAAPMRHVA